MAYYTQVYKLTYSVDSDRVWLALQQAVADMDGAHLDRIDANIRSLEFSIVVSQNPWGQWVDVRVEPASQGGSDVHVRATPKHTFWISKWANEGAASKATRQLHKGIKRALNDTAPTSPDDSE